MFIHKMILMQLLAYLCKLFCYVLHFFAEAKENKTLNMTAKYLLSTYREGFRPSRRVPDELAGSPINDNNIMFKLDLPCSMRRIFEEEMSSAKAERVCMAQTIDKEEYLSILVDFGMKMLEKICKSHDALNELFWVSCSFPHYCFNCTSDKIKLDNFGF